MRKQGVIFTPEEEKKDHMKKSQQMRYFKNIKIIPKDDVYFVKYSQEYFAALNTTMKNHLFKTVKELQKKPYEKYIPQIITEENLLQMCKDHDSEANKPKPKHPMTDGEKKKKEINQEQQKLNPIIKK